MLRMKSADYVAMFMKPLLKNGLEMTRAQNDFFQNLAIQNSLRFLDDFLSTSNILQEPSVISLTSIADQYVTNFHWFGGNASIFATVNKIKPKIKSLSSKTVTINFMTRSRKFSKGKGGVRTMEEENGRSSRRRDDILPK